MHKHFYCLAICLSCVVIGRAQNPQEAPSWNPLFTSDTLTVRDGIILSTGKPTGVMRYVPLFNGRNLDGWKIPAGDNGHWKVVDEVIDYDAMSEAPGEKSLESNHEFANFNLIVDWRIKETPYINPRVAKILPDGSEAVDVDGKPITLSVPDSDSGIFLRGSDKHQVNIWCWPIGSGEMYGIRRDKTMSAQVRAAVTPRVKADNEVGKWNRFEITVIGQEVTVVLNGQTVIEKASIPDLPPKGSIFLQHHGSQKNGQWTGPPSLVQFRNIMIQELP